MTDNVGLVAEKIVAESLDDLQKKNNYILWSPHYLGSHSKAFIGAFAWWVVSNKEFYIDDVTTTRVSGNIIMQAFSDLLPDGFNYMMSAYRKADPNIDDASLVKRVIQRVQACLPTGLGEEAMKRGSPNNRFGGELARFLRPELTHSMNLLMGAIQNNNTIHIDDIAQAQENYLLLMHGDGPGVYIRETPDMPHAGYIGQAGDISKRDHKNAHHRLVAIFATETKQAAEIAEKVLFGILKDKYGDKFYMPDGTRGRVNLRNKKPLLEAVKETIGPVRSLFHNRISIIDGEQTKPSDALRTLRETFAANNNAPRQVEGYYSDENKKKRKEAKLNGGEIAAK